MQGAVGARTLAVAIYDRPPGAPFIDTAEAFKRKTRPELRWRPGNDPWGAQTFRVYMDGVVIGTTTNTTLVPATPLTTGKHTWQVESVWVKRREGPERVLSAYRLLLDLPPRRVPGTGGPLGLPLRRGRRPATTEGTAETASRTASEGRSL